jgi:hypothetical protein
LGLTKAEAARRSGLGTSQHWWNVEYGMQPDIRSSTLAAIARTLHCKMDDLYSMDEPTPRRKPRKK